MLFIIQYYIDFYFNYDSISVKRKGKNITMQTPRDVPFGQMTTLECCQCLVAGKMPNGTIIEDKARRDGLSRIIPIIKNGILGDQESLGNDWIQCHPQDSFIIDLNERIALITNAENILEKLS